MAISRTAIDNSIWDVRILLIRKLGVDEADRKMHPLEWYISTGRASTEFLRAFIESDPSNIADLLMKRGSDEQVIRRLKKHLGKEQK